MNVVGFDPGKKTGWAWFRDGELHQCGVLKDLQPWPMFARRGLVVIEKPRVYPYGKKKVNPADLIDLAIIVGAIDERMRQLQYERKHVEPRAWKGAAPKGVHNGRILAVLSQQEISVLPKNKRITKTDPTGYDNNMLDAVGLGLYGLRRLVV